MIEIDQIAYADTKTFENTVQAFARFEQELSSATSHVLFLKNVSPDKKVREAIETAEKTFDDLNIKLDNRKDLYNSFLQYKNVTN